MFLQLLASELQKVPDKVSEVHGDERQLYTVLQTFGKEGYNGDVEKDLEILSSIRFKQYREETQPVRLNLQGVEVGILKAPHYQTSQMQEEDDFV
jgi:hypothetical protein